MTRIRIENRYPSRRSTELCHYVITTTSFGEMALRIVRARFKPALLKLNVATALLVVSAMAASAEPKTFRNAGLQNEMLVTLDVTEKKVTGTFFTGDYGESQTSKRFSGEVVATPEGKRGVYMHIRFEKEVPYSPPPGTEILQWYLKIVDHRAHLFIPMQERSYTSNTPKWVINDVEFVPTTSTADHRW